MFKKNKNTCKHTEMVTSHHQEPFIWDRKSCRENSLDIVSWFWWISNCLHHIFYKISNFPKNVILMDAISHKLIGFDFSILSFDKFLAEIVSICKSLEVYTAKYNNYNTVQFKLYSQEKYVSYHADTCITNYY